jgi:dihydrofolate reductase
VTVDGFTAGLLQSFEHPFRDNFDPDFLTRWVFSKLEKNNHQIEIAAILDGGDFIMGSNTIGPENRRATAEWKRWWGSNPLSHAPVFVLFLKQRAPIQMEDGTTYYFVTQGIESALARAKAVAGQRHVKIAGGAILLISF